MEDDYYDKCARQLRDKLKVTNLHVEKEVEERRDKKTLCREENIRLKRRLNIVCTHLPLQSKVTYIYNM